MDNKDNNIEELEEQEIENDNFSDDTDFNENSNNNQSYGSYATPSPRNGNFFQGFTAGFKNGMHGGVNPNNDNLARGINPNKNNQNHNTDKKNDDTKKKLNTKENNKNRNPIPGIINKVNRKNKNANNKENNSNNNKGGLNKKENDSNQESSKNPFKKQDNELKQAESQSEGAQLFNKIKKIAKRFVKFLIFLGPIGIIIFIVLLLIILIVVILGGSEAYGSTDGYINGICKDGVTVTNKSGSIIGTYSLEEYVAGVVAAENTYEVKGNIEAMKAQAVAVRTYVLYRTDFCEDSIENSQYAQVMKDPTELSTRAATETQGLVLEYDGDIFSSEYDSYYGTCTSSGCTATYRKIPSTETHTVTLSAKFANMVAGGHGRGMSQLAARDLQDQGYDYEEILKYFYADGVEISKLVNIDSAGLVLDEDTEFLMRLARPQRTNEFYYYQDSNNYGRYWEGECAWYGTARAAEILGSIGSSKTWTSNPNGGGFCGTTDAQNFDKSYNYREPKQGAIVSWGKTNDFGHVAIVEKVEGNEVTISEAYLGLGEKVGSGIWSKNYIRYGGPGGTQSPSRAKENCEYGSATGCFRSTTLTIDQMATYNGSYSFNCYIYLVE